MKAAVRAPRPRTRPDSVRVEVTGPWAPYSFVSPQDAEPAEGTASP
ncbi:GvpL/GvpF family gas vesicle protein [Streptomyces sp. NPDC057486]